MPRTTGKTEVLPSVVNQGALDQANVALNLQGEKARQLMAAYNVTHANADGLEAEIRGYQQTAVEAMFAIGARLLVMRAVTERGDWLQRLERLNMAPRAAQRVMQATVKFADPSKPRDKLLQLGRGKLIELLTLDDEQLDELQETGELLELDLDEIASMSTSELRKELREVKAQLGAKDKLLKKRGEEIDRLQERVERAFVPEEGSAAQTEREQAQYLALQEAHTEALAVLARLAVVVRDIKGSPDGCSEAMSFAAESAMQHTCKRLVDIAGEHGLSIDLEEEITPAWLQVPDTAVAKSTKRKA